MNKKYSYITHPQTLGGGKTLISLDNEQISQDLENRHYRDYLEWVKQGNTTEEWIPE